MYNDHPKRCAFTHCNTATLRIRCAHVRALCTIQSLSSQIEPSPSQDVDAAKKGSATTTVGPAAKRAAPKKATGAKAKKASGKKAANNVDTSTAPASHEPARKKTDWGAQKTGLKTSPINNKVYLPEASDTTPDDVATKQKAKKKVVVTKEHKAMPKEKQKAKKKVVTKEPKAIPKGEQKTKKKVVTKEPKAMPKGEQKTKKGVVIKTQEPTPKQRQRNQKRGSFFRRKPKDTRSYVRIRSRSGHVSEILLGECSKCWVSAPSYRTPAPPHPRH